MEGSTISKLLIFAKKFFFSYYNYFFCYISRGMYWLIGLFRILRLGTFGLEWLLLGFLFAFVLKLDFWDICCGAFWGILILVWFCDWCTFLGLMLNEILILKGGCFIFYPFLVLFIINYIRLLTASKQMKIEPYCFLIKTPFLWFWVISKKYQ